MVAAVWMCWAMVSKGFDGCHEYHTCQHGTLNEGDETFCLLRFRSLRCEDVKPSGQ